MIATTTFLDQLERYGNLARRATASYLPGEDSAPYLVAPAGEYLGRGGKSLRPALCLATCEAFGGDTSAALPTAAAIELLHTSFLVHDDVEDDSELRRGEPTLHRMFGTGVAINAGDGLAVFALGALRENQRLLGRRLASRIWSEFEFMARQTVEGQAVELGWQREGHVDVTPDDYLDLIMKKTCWYTTVLPLRSGALIGRGPASELSLMVRFGFFLGAAFQIRDDILNLIGDPEVYGKELLGDLREGKRTLMVIHSLAAADAGDRRLVVGFLTRSRAERTDEAVAEVFDVMQRYGSVAFAEQFARGIAKSARVAFEEAFADVAPSPARDFVVDLIPYMVERDR
jgi:geranylgeranyl diphosphate synthase type II